VEYELYGVGTDDYSDLHTYVPSKLYERYHVFSRYTSPVSAPTSSPSRL